MEAELKSQLTFHLTGRRPAADHAAPDAASFRPAHFARLRDLAALRYDYPLVLVDGAADYAFAIPLSGLVDRVSSEIAKGDGGDAIARHMLRIERRVRERVARGASDSLGALWDSAAREEGAPEETAIAAGVARARAAFGVDGLVVDCDAALPARFVRHAWEAVERRKAKRFSAEINRLVHGLEEILRADFAASEAGLAATNLRASIGSAHAEVFDFDIMSRLLGKRAGQGTLPAERRERITELLTALEAGDFYVSPTRGAAERRPAFCFDSCAGALAAFREREPKSIAKARAIATAELEIAGEYREEVHGPFFEAFGEDGLDPADRARFPDYLVVIDAERQSAQDAATMMEILAAGLPMKILVQTDDILAPMPFGDGGIDVRDRQRARMAIGLGNVHVVAACGANLLAMRERVRAALEYPGPALVTVFSGANPNSRGIAPYLIAAAALEARAFPSVAFDPSAGPDRAARFDLAANPAADSDWPIHAFTSEDHEQKALREDLAFTFVDFLACDLRYAKHFAVVSREHWTSNMVPVAQLLDRESDPASDAVPYVLLVDGDARVHRAIVDARLLREARRARARWHALREEGVSQVAAQPAAPVGETQAAMAPVVAVAATPAAPEPAPAAKSDDAFIETPRCTTCNECTNINPRMFAYNENRQAYIADLKAGTFAQLVEAAESCQVSIIHPGKPRDPNEPGIDELLARAAAFP